jgi:hypothetical protein
MNLPKAFTKQLLEYQILGTTLTIFIKFPEINSSQLTFLQQSQHYTTGTYTLCGGGGDLAENIWPGRRDQQKNFQIG